jgi:hypothetical protein
MCVRDANRTEKSRIRTPRTDTHSYVHIARGMSMQNRQISQKKKKKKHHYFANQLMVPQ